MPGKQFSEGKPYLSIVEGILRQTVNKDTLNAVERKYEIKKQGEKTIEGIKYELLHKEWSGKIENLSIKDGKFGQVLEIEFDDAILTLSTKSKYFSNFAKKVKNINFNQTAVISPYDFEPDGNKRTGISIYQKGEKLPIYYWDKENEKVINGLPQAVGDTSQFDNDDWISHFIIEKKFLIKEIEEVMANVENIPKESLEEPTTEETPFDEEDKEIDNSEIKDDEIVGGKKEDKLIENNKNNVKVEDVPF